MNEGKKVLANDGLGHRKRRHKNVLMVRHEDSLTLIVFQGETIPGVAKVTWRGYTKNGQWSHNTWELWLPDHVDFAVLHQSWEEGRYVPEESWDAALSGVAQRLGIERAGNEAAIEAFIRRDLAKAAERLDANERFWIGGDDMLQSLKKHDEAVVKAAQELHRAVKDAQQASKRV